MLAFENIREQALAQVFDGQPVGVDITFTEISAAWTRLGLRKSDLHEAICKMVEGQYLVSRNLSGSLGFALTNEGAQRFNLMRQHQGDLQSWLKQRREILPQEPTSGGLDDAIRQCPA